MTHRELHGYEKLLKDFVPAAVGLNPRGKGAVSAYPRGAPVITIHGGRGTGKTAVCEELHDTYVNRLHVAKWPMPGTRPVSLDQPLDQVDPLASRPLAALAWLVHELNVDVGKFGRIEFPRFTYGLIAATTLYEPPGTAGPDDQDDGPGLADLQRLEAKRHDLESALLDNGGEERPLRDLLGAWTEAAIPLLGWIAPGLSPLEDLFRQFVRQATERGGAGLHQAALRWWDARLQGIAGSGIRKLLDFVFLSLRLQVPARARHNLEEQLTAAFLADIDAHYGRWNPRIRPLPLILLDDTHTSTGSRLFGLLLAAYAGAGTGKRPLIIATRLGAVRHPASTQHEHPVGVTQIDTLDWESPNSDAPDEWQVWLRAPALRADSIATALGALCPRGLPDVIEQISAGRAGCAWPLVEAAREDLRTGTRSVLRRRRPKELGRALLDLRPAGAARERTVADALLRDLVPEQGLIDGLLPLAVALRGEDVPGLPPLRAETDAVRTRIRTFLGAEHWNRTPWAGDDGFVPVVADRALRELLLHRLRTRCTPAHGESGSDDAFVYWTQLHSAARGRYGRPSPDGDPAAYTAYLHHSLALGLFETTVAGLHAAFTGSDPRSWLAAVQFVCAAPHPPDGYVVRHPEPSVSCPACPEPGPNDRHQAIRELVDALWGLSTLSSLYTDDPDSEDNPLRQLLSGFDAATREAARRWPTLLAQGRRVPELPITGRGH